MDQRTDKESRLEATPGRDTKPAIGETRKSPSFIDRMRQRRRPILIVTALIIAAIVGTVAYWLNTSGYESTDDAFIDARTVSISPQVGGAIVDVPVTDNQLVEAGAVLVRIDDRDFRAQSIRPTPRSTRPRPTSPISMPRSTPSRPASIKPTNRRRRRKRR